MRKIITDINNGLHETKKVSRCRVCNAIIMKEQKFCFDHQTKSAGDNQKGE